MQFRFLKYFCVLGEELHFGRAASRLSITQPPLSAAVKALELDLGVKLLVRTSKVVQLTPAGAAFLVEANAILDRVAQAQSIARGVDRGTHGRLDVSTAGSLLFREVPLVLSNFRRALPGVDAVLHELSTHEQLQALSRGQVQVAFINGATTPPRLKSIGLQSDVFALCVHEHHRLARRRRVGLEELHDEKFVMLSRPGAPAQHDVLLAQLRAAGIDPQTADEARSWITIVALVAQDDGVALIPSSLRNARMAGVRFVALEPDALPAPAMMVWNPAVDSPALHQFIESARSSIAAYAMRPPARAAQESRGR
jgi:DNA-binding transcriptional LysR family regulator